MTSGSLPSNPFVAAGMIEDPKLFVGRKDELQAIASQMSGVQPTSINLIGEKRIGKSSLLQMAGGLVCEARQQRHDEKLYSSVLFKSHYLNCFE